MRPHPLIIAIFGFILFGAGYFVGRQDPAAGSQSDAMETPKRERPLSSPDAETYQPPANFAIRLTDADYSGRKDLIGAIDSKNLFVHLEQLLAESSPDGLDYHLKSSIEAMLKRSMEADPKGTVDWILGIEHTGNRNYLFGEVIDEEENKAWVAENFDQLLTSCRSAANSHDLLKSVIGTKTETSPAEAILLSKELLKKDSGEIDFPRGLAEASAKAGWDTLFEYYKDSWLPDFGSSGWVWGGDFPRDFDFASFAVAWGKHEEGLNLPEKGRFYEPPEMLWRTWSERDPQAAYEFMNSGGSRTFDLDTFFDGYSKSASPGEFLETSESIVVNDPKTRDEVGEGVVSYLGHRPDGMPQLTEKIVRNQVAPALLAGVIRESIASDEILEKIGNPILEAITRSERLGIIRDAYTRQGSGGDGSYYMGSSTIDRLVPVLIELGHSEAEIRATLEND
jgi:hypothetical protein